MNIVKSFKVESTLAAYRIVTHSTSAAMTVKYPASTLRPFIGVTYDTVLDTVGAIPIVVAGIAKVFFNDTCTTGNLVSADTSGRGIAKAAFGATSTAITTTGAYIGVLVGATVAATGTIANVLIMPGFER
jgi:hypothetical protein